METINSYSLEGYARFSFFDSESAYSILSYLLVLIIENGKRVFFVDMNICFSQCEKKNYKVPKRHQNCVMHFLKTILKSYSLFYMETEKQVQW